VLWDFIDIINNQTAPKSCYIAFSATKMRRTDVILQYHKAEALIEHVGDVSSLSGKVQRIHEDYFKKHNLQTTLFDNPPADLHAAAANSHQLQAVYGASGNSVDKNSVPAFQTIDVTRAANPPKNVVLEIVFKQPLSIQIFNMRMGGYLRAGVKGKKAEIADPDFEYVLDNAVMEFGRGQVKQGGPPERSSDKLKAGGFCDHYEHITNVSGREVFWRCPASRPASGVECIKVSVLAPQKNPLLVRSIRVRSSRARRTSALVDGVEMPPPLGSVNSWAVAAASAVALLRGDSFAIDSPRQLLAGPDGKARELEFVRWQERQMVWSLTVCVAFGCGGLAGLLGCVGYRLQSNVGRKARKSRSKVSQA